MQLEEIYALAVDLGIRHDLRGQARVQRNLQRVNEQYAKLDDKKKSYFDLQRLTNPYGDTRILHNATKDIKRVMCGIDIDAAELLIAKQMGDIDLVIAHHPSGHALAGLHDVMNLQVEVLADYGVPINVAQSLLRLRIQEVSRGVNSSNLYKTTDAARHLGLGLMTVHTPADNLVAHFLRHTIEHQSYTYVSEILDRLMEIPEYQEAERKGFGPRLFAGSPDNFAGKIAITEITGGTEGSPDIYEKMAQAGVGTIVGMHMSEKHKAAAEKSHINALIAGHMSSDSIGMNLFLDELEKRGVEIVPCSGLIRVSRVAKVNI